MRRNFLPAMLGGMGMAIALASMGEGIVSTVVAQEASLAIEEVIVTARKREESAQEVPVAITALSQELTQSTIRDLTDLNGFAPNVRIGNDRSRSNAASITIRGISPTRTDDNSFDSPIAVMIDGIYLGTLGGQLLENFDLERVEILRGPQGTLFGKNTVGGVVNVIRSRPTGELGGRFKVTAGKWDQREFRGVLNMPIIEDKLAGKVFFSGIKNDGWMPNTTVERRVPKTDYENYGATFLLTPNDRFEALLTVEKFADDSELGAFLGNYNLAPGVAAKPSDPRQQDLSEGFLSCTLFASGAFPQWNSDVPCRTSLDVPKVSTSDLPNPANTDVEAYTLNMSYDVSDNIRIASVTGYRDGVEDRIYDFDGTESNHITIERLNDYDQFSQELRVEASWSNLSVVVGGYYWNSEFEQDWVTGGEFWKFVGTLGTSGYDLTNNTWLNPATTGPSPLELCWALAFGNVRCDTGATLEGLGPAYTQRLLESQETESIAFFAQAEWEFVPNWILTAGLRWTEEKKDFMAGQAYLASMARQRVRNFPDYAILDNKWSEISPKLGLSHQLSDDILIYASYSEGFHSGGFFGVNQNVADFIRDQYDPEFANSWEGGIKSQLFNNRVQLNAAYFFNDFKDKQEQAVQFDPSTNTVATVFDNVATATYQGVEVELQWVASEYLNVFASFGWLDAEYDEFETDLNPNDDAAFGSVVEDATHLTPRNAPEITYGVGAVFSMPAGPGTLEVYGKYDWVDEIETNLLNLDVGRVSSQENLNASISYLYGNMSLTLFGRNLTDEIYEVPAIIAPLFASSTIVPGTSWGVEFEMEL